MMRGYFIDRWKQLPSIINVCHKGIEPPARFMREIYDVGIHGLTSGEADRKNVREIAT